MKAEERHKLKTNELANWLGRVPAFGRKYAYWLIGLVVVVVLGVGGWLIYSWHKDAVRTEKWDALAKASQVGDPAERANQLAQFVKDHGDNDTPTSWALYQEAEAIQEQAVSGRPGADQLRRRAEELYQKLINERAYDPVVTPMARISLANLLLGGSQPELERARDLFLTVQADTKADGALRQMAGLSAGQLSNPEQIAFAATTAPEEPDIFRSPGFETRIPIVPGGSPLTPGGDGGDTGEPKSR
jgi:predicted negative regulator of RcsB-dependent stress response